MSASLAVVPPPGKIGRLREQQMEIKRTDEEHERRYFTKWGRRNSQEGVLKVAPSPKIVKYIDILAKAWGWEMLVPYDDSVELSDYCNYLKHYYKENCNVIAEVTGSNLVDVAETCLKKENELVSLWDSKAEEWSNGILPQKNYILNSLIQEFADKIKQSGEEISDAPTAALLCITKEANLICEMLNRDASPKGYLITQSTEIRMCALSLMSHQSYGVAAAAAMVATSIRSLTMSKNKKPFDPFDIDLDNDFMLGRQVRFRTLHLMISILEESPVVPAAGHTFAKEKSFSGNVPRNDITPAEAGNTTWDNLKDQENITGANISKKRKEDANKEEDDQDHGSCQSGRKLSKMEGRCHNLGLGDDHGIPLRRGRLLMGSLEETMENQMEIGTDEDRRAFEFSSEDLEEGSDMFGRTYGWDRLLPFMDSIAWSDYCKYLRQYYKHNVSFVADFTGSFVSSAHVCLKKEKELVSLWNARVRYIPDRIWPVNTIIQSNLIQERANSIMLSEGAKHSAASTVAFACITKEAELMCELLKHGAQPTDDIIQQCGAIRMCALGLVHHDLHAAATMLGITKECNLLCDFIRKENKLITFGIFSRHVLEECRLIRMRTLDAMLTILKGSSYPSSKMWPVLRSTRNNVGGQLMDKFSFVLG